MEPRDLVRRAEEMGLDAVCITEHNAAWEEDALRALGDGSSVRLFGGVEVSTEWGDVLVFGLEGEAPRAGRIKELRRIVDRSGGVMIAAHPFRRYSVAGVFNGLCTRAEVELAQEVLTPLGLRGVGGSDSHAPHTLGVCYTVFERRLATVRDLVAEFKAGRFQAVHRGFELTF